MTMRDQPAGAASDPAPVVLIVDGSQADRLAAGRLVEETFGFRVAYTDSAREAQAILHEQQPILVLTDPALPDANGLDLVEIVRRHHPQTPIVLMTGQGNEALALHALLRGAASYVPKKSLTGDLVDTLEQVLAAAQRHRQEQRLQEFLTRLEYHFVLDNDRTLIPVLVGFIQEQLGHLRLCDDTARLRVGIALEEALLNAILHGNLEVGSDLRHESDTLFQQLSEQRRGQLPYRDRRVHCDVLLTRSEATFVIRDEGPGFKPAQLPDPTDPANLEQISGRGLLLIRTFMDEVQFNATGNQLTLIKRRCGEAGK